LKKFKLPVKKGTGIYILSGKELKQLKLNSEERSLIKPWFKNSDIQRWVTKTRTDRFLIYYTTKGNYDDVGNVQRHLSQFKPILINRKTRSGTGTISIKDYGNFVCGKKYISYVMNASAFKRGDYYSVSYPRDQRVFEGSKIVVPQRSPRNTFAYNTGPWYASADVYFILKKSADYDLKYLLGVLNSKLLYYWLYHKGKRKGEMLELYIRPLSEIPIKSVSPIKQQPIIGLVERILAAKQGDAEADTAALEREIDELLYALYGLTDEEKALVENKAK
jgi:adenine-specific DNA-methyltransferase